MPKDAHLGVVGEAVAHHPGRTRGRQRRQQRGHPRVVGAGDQEPARRDPLHEHLEHLGVGLRGVMVIEMVGLDVGDHRAMGGEGQERAIGLVRFDHENVAAALVRARAGLVEFPADGERRVQSDRLQGHGEHRGGRRLAVRAGHADAAGTGHQRGQRLGPDHHGDAPLPGRLHLDVVRADRRRHHDRGGAGRQQFEIRRIVADHGAHSAVGQAGQHVRALRVRSGHQKSAIGQDPGNGAHPGSAHPDQVGPGQ